MMFLSSTTSNSASTSHPDSTVSDAILLVSLANLEQERVKQKRTRRTRSKKKLRQYKHVYGYFTALHRGRLTKENPGMDWKEISELVAQKWHAMSPRERTMHRLDMEAKNRSLEEEFIAANVIDLT